MNALNFRFLRIFSHKHYNKLMNSTFLETSRLGLYNNVENYT
jgi:hypothetical protein